jgi:hypothetical protein
MRLLNRYLLRELLLPLGVCLSGFLVFWIAFDLFNDLKTFQEEHATLKGLAQLYGIRLPDLLMTILPVGELLGLLYALTHLARHNEITAIGGGRQPVADRPAVFRHRHPVFGGLYWLNEEAAAHAVEREEELRHSWVDPQGSASARLWRANVNFQNSTEHRAWSVGRFNMASYRDGAAPGGHVPAEGSVPRIDGQRRPLDQQRLEPHQWPGTAAPLRR